MAAGSDPSRPFSMQLRVIRRLNSSLCRAGLQTERAGSAGLHSTAKLVSLAPLRDDVPLLDPCCGQLSAGAEVDLGIKGRTRFIDFHHVASALWVPPGFRERPQTAPIGKQQSICIDQREDKAWNSRRISDALLRARLNGPGRIQQPFQKLSTNGTSVHSSLCHEHAGLQCTTPLVLASQQKGAKDQDSKDASSSQKTLWRDDSAALRHFLYTSATQRSYEGVGWDSKLPRRLKAPETTLEGPADAVSGRPSWRRCNSRPQLWQRVGAEWSGRQLRSRADAKKPISFCSGYSRAGQTPLHRCTLLPQSGKISSENMDEMDSMDEDFHLLTLKRSVVAACTPTARRTTIPGYTGKAVAADAAASGATLEPRSCLSGHRAPLSRMVTTVTPCNPFLRPVPPVSQANT